MRPVDKSKYSSNKKKYIPYASAKDDLIEALGPFCSYCERPAYYSALDVEHIEDKKNNPSKKYDWNNFLLGCKNCNPIKGTKPINYKTILLPHIDNTFVIFSYLESGVIIINPEISDELKLKAKELSDLVGLDRIPGHPDYSTKDKRWVERKKAWELSQRYLNKFKQKSCDVETIKDLAANVGFWSIWMTVFHDHKQVIDQLIKAFKGTRSEFFDS